LQIQEPPEPETDTNPKRVRSGTAISVNNTFRIERRKRFLLRERRKSNLEQGAEKVFGSGHGDSLELAAAMRGDDSYRAVCGKAGAGGTVAAGDRQDRERSFEAYAALFRRAIMQFDRESIWPAPQLRARLLRARLLRAFYPICSEEKLVERLDIGLLPRWFVGLGIDDPLWIYYVYPKPRLSDRR